MTPERTRSIRRGVLTLVAVATVYELVARSGHFAPVLMPTLGTVAGTLVDSILDGSMVLHAAATLYRVLLGFGLAVVVGLPLGVMMGRFRPVENFVLPLASALMPIPSLAWVPVFILWFGLGNTVTILIVFYAALFPMLLNTWSGVRSVNPIWLRAAGAMGADEHSLFWKVIIPGASPFIITGLRQSFRGRCCSGCYLLDPSHVCLTNRTGLVRMELDRERRSRWQKTGSPDMAGRLRTLPD